MRKLLLVLLVIVTVFALGFAVACGEKNSGSSDSVSLGDSSSEPMEITVESVEYIDGIPEHVYVGQSVSLKNLKIKVTYSDGSSEEISYSTENKSAFSVNCDTSELGVTTATITYNGVAFEVELEVIFSVDSVVLPDFVNDFNAQKGESSAFADKDQVYCVGDDSLFYFSPVVTAWVGEELVVFDEPGEVEIVAKLAILNGEVYEEITDYASYVEIDTKKASFDFTSEAIGQFFKLSVYPAVLTDEEEIAHYTKEFEFKVVDGYNVYTALDLLLWDNAKEVARNYRINNGLHVDANTINALVLHNNILLQSSDLPAAYFYDETRDANVFAGLSAEKKKELQGTLKDFAELIKRDLGKEGTFAFEGNYFTIDASELPFIRMESGDNSLNAEPTSVVSHSNLFGVQGTARQDGCETSEYFTMNNVNFIGNLNRQETAECSGGLILIKVIQAQASISNIVAKRWYTAMFVEENAVGHEVTLDKCVLEDAYSSLVYLWGGIININNSRIYGAGGPAIIGAHSSPTKADKGRNGSYGWYSSINIDDNSVVASYVTGQEAWFAQFSAQSVVGQIVALDALFQGLGRTFTTNKYDEGGNVQTLVNLSVILMSGDAEGLSFDPIKGNASFGAHKMDFDGAYTKPFLTALAGMGAPIFQSTTEAGILAYAGQNPQMPQLPVLYTLSGLATMTPVDFTTGEHLTLPLLTTDVGHLNLYYATAGSAGYLGAILGDYRVLGN